MTIRQAIWKIGAKPEPLPSASLPSEATLEAMIVAYSSILHDQWMIIGQQVETGYGGRLDLLAIAPDVTPIILRRWRGGSSACSQHRVISGCCAAQRSWRQVEPLAGIRDDHSDVRSSERKIWMSGTRR